MCTLKITVEQETATHIVGRGCFVQMWAALTTILSHMAPASCQALHPAEK
jgi:hypothetical protein